MIEQWDYYKEQQGIELANRWRDAVADTVKSLLVFTERGARCRLPNKRLRRLRWIPVPHFPYRVFYLFDPDSRALLVVHLLHNKRDIADLLMEAVSEMDEDVSDPMKGEPGK
ncbi:Plasmid stabilization system protein ParE [Granulicella rosea]|uniref:Plasmid stabilization system protein ParE n=2 Tax=Granulicella rosea TaxID=474952 RepID=A0A239DGP9_9BACT|nr:Plasmid stabilization system protein ParE [Granulicella rosea]